jgi:hypothetical protein
MTIHQYLTFFLIMISLSFVLIVPTYYSMFFPLIFLALSYLFISAILFIYLSRLGSKIGLLFGILCNLLYLFVGAQRKLFEIRLAFYSLSSSRKMDRINLYQSL